MAGGAASTDTRLVLDRRRARLVRQCMSSIRGRKHGEAMLVLRRQGATPCKVARPA